MERHEIEVFLTLAEELHFGRTGQRLNISQGRVSQTVQRLERRFGLRLFERTSRRVSLTPAGARFRDDLLPAQQQVERAISRVMAAGRGVAGVLEVGYSSPMAADVMMAAARAFEAEHPDCQVRIREIQLADPLGPLRSGAVDLQLTEFPVEETDITTGPVVLSQQRGLVVPADHHFATRDSLSVEDYADAVMIPLVGDAIPPRWLDHHYPRTTPAGRPIPQARPARFWQEVPARVAAGEGVSLVSMGAEAYVSRPGLVFVPFHDAPPMEYGLMWRSISETALVRAFAAAVYATARS